MVTYIFFNLSSCSLSHGPNEQNSFNLIHKKKMAVTRKKAVPMSDLVFVNSSEGQKPHKK